MGLVYLPTFGLIFMINLSIINIPYMDPMGKVQTSRKFAVPQKDADALQNSWQVQPWEVGKGWRFSVEFLLEWWAQNSTYKGYNQSYPFIFGRL